MKFPGRGLYAITQTDNKSTESVLNEVTAAIKGGAVVVQYRDKNLQDKTYLAGKLLKICHQNNVPLIVNDDIELALTIGADGVHLGKNDSDILLARKRVGSDFIIGISCYNSIEHAVKMQRHGATYVAFGRFFPSESKPLATPADLETLQQAKHLLNIPIVAIGGILPENGLQLLNAGADLLAVIGGLFNLYPEQRARQYCALFEKNYFEAER